MRFRRTDIPLPAGLTLAMGLLAAGVLPSGRAAAASSPGSRTDYESQIAASVHAGLECASCHDGLRAEELLRTAAIAPVDCEGCHASGTAAGTDHARSGGASSRASCKGCHGTHAIARSAHAASLRLLLAGGILALAAGILWRLRSIRVRALLRAAPGWRSGEPLARLFRIAFLQRRVASRPRGWPHAALFAAVTGLTLALILDALDRELLRAAGWSLLAGAARHWFAAAVDALGLLLIAGSSAALVRQFTRRDGPEAGVRITNAAILSALLALAVGGFLLEGVQALLHPFAWSGWSFVGTPVARALGAALDPSAAPTIQAALWWSHLVLVVALLAALPATSLFHAIAAPLNALVAPEHPRRELPAPFDLRDLIARNEFDVKVGACRVSELDDGLRLGLLACTSCGRCDEVCPAHQSGAALSPRRLVRTLRGRMAGKDADADILEGTLPEAELWACTSCAACVEACPVLVGPANLVIPFRRELVSRQRLDHRQAAMLSALQRCSNPYGLAPADRDALPRRLGIPSPDEAPGADWLYWIGCAGASDERIGRVVEATVRILRAAV
jgi:ferredoxin